MLRPDDILEFWFNQAGSSKWYAKSDAFDADIRARFEDFSVGAAARVKQYGHHKWQAEARSSLALILALDQFPRNMYRNTKGAFAWDDLALLCADKALEQGHDLACGQDVRAFFYLPYMHAENIKMQDKCVRLMDMRIDAAENLFHAQEHRKLIARFGRFPHRNNILARESTDAEIEFLQGGGYAP